jgi:hypothetical protein
MLRWAFSTFVVFGVAFAFLARSAPSPAPSQPIQFSHKAHLDYFREGRHRRDMIALHEELAIKDFGDKSPVAEVGKRPCSSCHRDFDENANDLVKLARCGECHRAYLEKDWLEGSDQKPCLGCHNTAADSLQASIPNTNTCAACHEKPRGTDPEESKVLKFIKQQKTIRWTRVHDYLPGDIIFSHARHVDAGRVACQQCHGQVEQAEGPLALNVTLGMEDCMTCHDVSHADNDCLACHK